MGMRIKRRQQWAEMHVSLNAIQWSLNGEKKNLWGGCLLSRKANAGWEDATTPTAPFIMDS